MLKKKAVGGEKLHGKLKNASAFDLTIPLVEIYANNNNEKRKEKKNH